MSPGLLVLAGALTAGAPPRGLINTQVVDANWTTFIDLSRNSDVNLLADAFGLVLSIKSDRIVLLGATDSRA